jgi:hypothetical protein
MLSQVCATQHGETISKWERTVLRVSVWSTLIGLSLALSPGGQDASTPTVSVSLADATRSVPFEITVVSGQKDIIVPYCGEGEGGSETLCNLAIHIEVESKNGWHRIKPRYPEVVLGGVPPDKWNPQVIPAKHRHDFYFAFSKNDFAVERGQRLRIVVYAWPDEPSMRTGRDPIRLTSAAFNCP